MGNLTIKRNALDRLRGAEYQTIYDGQVRIKFVELGHEYYVSEFIEAPYRKGGLGIKRKEWSAWERVHGPTTFIEIKDKSKTLVDWAVGLFYRSCQKIVSKRMLTEFDLKLAKGLHADKKKQAADMGTEAHKWIDAHIKGENPPMPDNQLVVHAVNQFVKWVKDLNVEFLTPDILMYSRKHRLPGKADSIVRINGKVYLWDAKTGSGIYNEAMMQTSAYVKLYYEMGLDKVYGPLAGRIVTRFEKRTEQEFRDEMAEKGRPNAIYRPVTTLFFDNNPEQLEDDFQGFLAAKTLWEWNKRAESALRKIKAKADIEV